MFNHVYSMYPYSTWHGRGKLWGERKKKTYLPKKEGRVEGKKNQHMHRNQTRDLLHARQESVAGHHGRCFNKLAFPLVYRLGRLRNHHQRRSWR